MGLDIKFDVLAQIPKLLRELVAIVQEPLEKQRTRRHDFFENEIAPIHKLMETIHEDYTKSFSELLHLFQSKKDVPRTIELLKKDRLVLLTKRKDVLAFGEALKSVKKRSYIRKREVAAFVEFAESIKSYIHGASPADSRVSWYSDFITEFELLAMMNQSPFLDSNFKSISNDNVVQLIQRAYSDAVHSDLPEAWQQYSAAFRKLKLELTR